MPVLKVLKNATNYALICRPRNEHKVDRDEELEFVRDPKFTRTVQCLDCGFDLELKLDETNNELYNIREI